jgi:septal ring factor EnvC (AmiA/AmiB activator)
MNKIKELENEKSNFVNKIKELENELKTQKDKNDKFNKENEKFKFKHEKLKNENEKNTKDIAQLLMDNMLLKLELNEEKEKCNSYIYQISNNVVNKI